MGNQPIHITAIAPYPIYPAKMGGQKGIALFYEAFSKCVPVTIITTKSNEIPVGLHAKFLRILSNSGWRYMNVFLFFSIRKILKENKSTHLILEHPYYGWLGILLQWLTPIRLIIHSHNIESMRFKTTQKSWWRLLYFYEKLVHRCADMNFFITDEDRAFACKTYGVSADRAVTITYGFELGEPPSEEEKRKAKEIIYRQHQLPFSDTLLLFNGTLDYEPNLNALKHILSDINPLLSSSELQYTILICGKNLPEDWDELRAYRSKHILYAGFVEDISMYFKAADVFINPVTDGGGIKTKLVEALGYNVSAVSTQSGAIGVPASITNGKLMTSEDGDWHAFTNNIIKSVKDPCNISEEFYAYFQWKHIARKACEALG